MKAGDGYAARHLSANDYYDKDKTVSGVWQGKGAEKLGLAGKEVTNEAFDLMTQARHPETGEFLRCRKSADRHNKEGEVIREAANIYDHVVAAPKSVSIMWGPGGDERLAEAHKKAVSEMLEVHERHATTRDQRFGQKVERETGNLCIARYEHDASRQLDPHLHSHCVVGNFTYDKELDRWTALHMGPLFQRFEFFNQVYLNALCREVEALGYETEKCRDSKGNDVFRLKGISKELEELYSQRSKERDEAIAKFMAREGRDPTPTEVTELVRATREDSLREITTEEVRASQVARLNERQIDEIASVRATAAKREITGFDKPVHDPMESVRYAIDHTFERKSVDFDFRIKTESLKHGRGKIDLPALEGCLHALESTGKILRHKNEITTQEALHREKQVIALVEHGIGLCRRLDKGRRDYDRGNLTDEQARAVGAILESRDFCTNLKGAPGTGKTHGVLAALRVELESRGHHLLALAPSKSSENELRGAGYTAAIQLKTLLDSKEFGLRIQNKILILDECSMVGADSMFRLMGEAKHRNARIIFAGDTKQAQSVEAGDIVRTLEDNSRMRSFEMTESVRFKDPLLKSIVHQMREDPEGAFDRMVEAGMVQQKPFFNRPKEVAKQAKEWGGALIVGPTHDENARSNHAVRREAKMKDAHILPRMEDLQWTQAQKKDLRNFEPGMSLIFHRPTLEAEIGTPYEITGREGRFLTTKEGLRFSIKQMDACNVFQKREASVSVGDKIVFLANSKGAFKCTNGEQAIVTGYDDRGRMTLEDGRAVPSNFQQWNLGYAVTAQKSQGKTVDNVIASGNMRRENAYVAVSRGRSNVAWFVDNIGMARDIIQISNARKSAIEIDRLVRARGARGRSAGQSVRATVGELVRDAMEMTWRSIPFVFGAGIPMAYNRAREAGKGLER